MIRINENISPSFGHVSDFDKVGINDEEDSKIEIKVQLNKKGKLTLNE